MTDALLEKIDIMVPTHGKLDLSIQCVDTIYGNTTHPFHLIVVDDSPSETDATVAYFERFCKTHKSCTFVHSDKPYKCGNQFFNIAIANMQTKYLATVMNSMKVEAEWEIEAIKLMNSDPKIGCIGFKCLFPDTHKIECAGIELYNGYMPIDIGRDLPGHALTKIYEVKAIQWAFALLRKEAVQGNLTEEIFHGFKGWDDIDNCFVLKSKGWKIFYCGFGVGIHHPRATRGDNSADAYLKNKANGHAFFKRWGLWNNYMESKKMDVSDKVSAEMKRDISAVLTEFQMCKLLFESRNRTLQMLVKQVLEKELKVDPEKYTMGIDPTRDSWDLKLRTDVPEPAPPKNGEGGKDEKDELEEQFKVRREAMAGPMQPVLKADATPDQSVATEGS